MEIETVTCCTPVQDSSPSQSGALIAMVTKGREDGRERREKRERERKDRRERREKREREREGRWKGCGGKGEGKQKAKDGEKRG